MTSLFPQVLRMKQDGAQEKVIEIYEEFIEPRSPMEINVEAATRRLIIDKVIAKTFDLGVFDDAIDEVAFLVYESIVAQFLAMQLRKKGSLTRYPCLFYPFDSRNNCSTRLPLFVLFVCLFSI